MDFELRLEFWWSRINLYQVFNSMFFVGMSFC
jgi:hypothetical protein